jgi:hypothetical protein
MIAIVRVGVQAIGVPIYRDSPEKVNSKQPKAVLKNLAAGGAGLISFET